ncbi:GAF and ANTAR domain-containing protein [Lentzea tibetensis]|uniref:GAF and ANTAR domain-containing protein n=1 Tax=Lentzea tibetensis TaxID=2591470 RepID=UPI001F25FFE7|nr:GAF and ANTAR domain-containing protein [Lentzea tibetensis]
MDRRLVAVQAEAVEQPVPLVVRAAASRAGSPPRAQASHVSQAVPFVGSVKQRRRGLGSSWKAACVHDETDPVERTQSQARSVNDDRPDPLERLDEATEALAVLRDSFSTEEPLGQALRRLAETATRAIPDADAVTITVMTPEPPRTVAASDEQLVDVDEKQYGANRGPCLESARTLQAVRAVVGEHRETWPEFESAAEEHGVRAYLSVPIVLPASGRSDAEHVGSLNIYSYTAAAFDPFDEGLMRLFTTAACATISSADQWQRSREQIKHLETALVSRAVIDQAKGALMAVHACTAEEAFAMLVRRSQHDNVKLREVAQDVLNAVVRL